MKFTLPVTLLAVATSVEGAVVQEGKCWCHSRGQACDTVKRAADAFAEALKSTANVAARDESDSKTATLARRQIDELALTIAASQYDPYSFYSGLQWGAHNKTEEQKTNERREAEAQWKRSAQAADRCQRFPGQPCWKRSEHKREPAAEAADWCQRFPGQPCWKRSEHKREPAAEAADWCQRFPGQPCRKRSENSDDIVRRNAEAEAAYWCQRFPGQPCWKRSKNIEEIMKRNSEAEAAYWCQRFPGQPCWKRSENTDMEVVKRAPEADTEAAYWCQRFPGQPCWKRDALASGKREADPFCTRFVGGSCWKRDGGVDLVEEHKRCISEGQACWKAKRAAAAVIDAIDRGNALAMKREADPEFCARSPGKPCWKRAAAAEAACHGPAGECTKATRDLHAMYNAARSIIEA
ncbi:hypothetical protein VTI74DRAFT_10503 [Chaetomium olivicolor]